MQFRCMHGTNEKANTQHAKKLLECFIALENKWELRDVHFCFCLIRHLLIERCRSSFAANICVMVYRKIKRTKFAVSNCQINSTSSNDRCRHSLRNQLR